MSEVAPPPKKKQPGPTPLYSFDTIFRTPEFREATWDQQDYVLNQMEKRYRRQYELESIARQKPADWGKFTRNMQQTKRMWSLTRQADFHLRELAKANVNWLGFQNPGEAESVRFFLEKMPDDMTDKEIVGLAESLMRYAGHEETMPTVVGEWLGKLSQLTTNLTSSARDNWTLGLKIKQLSDIPFEQWDWVDREGRSPMEVDPFAIINHIQPSEEYHAQRKAERDKLLEKEGPGATFGHDIDSAGDALFTPGDLIEYNRRKLTPEEIDYIRPIIEKERKRLLFMAKMRDVYSQKTTAADDSADFMPVQTKWYNEEGRIPTLVFNFAADDEDLGFGWTQQSVGGGFQVAFQSAPYLGMFLVPGGPMMVWGDFANQHRVRLEEIEIKHGIKFSGRDINRITLWSGATQTLVERMFGYFGTLSATRNLARLSPDGALATNVWMRTIANLAERAGGEIGEEGAQQSTPYVIEGIFNELGLLGLPEEEVRNLQGYMTEVLEPFMDQLPEMVMGMGLLSMIGMGTDVPTMRQARRDAERLNDVTWLKIWGFTPEVARKIVDERDPFTKVQMFKRYTAEGRDPMSETALDAREEFIAQHEAAQEALEKEQAAQKATRQREQEEMRAELLKDTQPELVKGKEADQLDYTLHTHAGQVKAVEVDGELHAVESEEQARQIVQAAGQYLQETQALQTTVRYWKTVMEAQRKGFDESTAATAGFFEAKHEALGEEAQETILLDEAYREIAKQDVDFDSFRERMEMAEASSIEAPFNELDQASRKVFGYHETRALRGKMVQDLAILYSGASFDVVVEEKAHAWLSEAFRVAKDPEAMLAEFDQWMEQTEQAVGEKVYDRTPKGRQEFFGEQARALFEFHQEKLPEPVRTSIEGAKRHYADQAESTSLLDSIRRAFKQFRMYFSNLLKRGIRLNKAFRDGSIDEGFEKAVMQAIGLDEATLEAMRQKYGELGFQGIGDLTNIEVPQAQENVTDPISEAEVESEQEAIQDALEELAERDAEYEDIDTSLDLGLDEDVNFAIRPSFGGWFANRKVRKQVKDLAQAMRERDRVQFQIQNQEEAFQGNMQGLTGAEVRYHQENLNSELQPLRNEAQALNATVRNLESKLQAVGWHEAQAQALLDEAQWVPDESAWVAFDVSEDLQRIFQQDRKMILVAPSDTTLDQAIDPDLAKTELGKQAKEQLSDAAGDYRLMLVGYNPETEALHFEDQGSAAEMSEAEMKEVEGGPNYAIRPALPTGQGGIYTAKLERYARPTKREAAILGDLGLTDDDRTLGRQRAYALARKSRSARQARKNYLKKYQAKPGQPAAYYDPETGVTLVDAQKVAADSERFRVHGDEQVALANSLALTEELAHALLDLPVFRDHAAFYKRLREVSQAEESVIRDIRVGAEVYFQGNTDISSLSFDLAQATGRNLDTGKFFEVAVEETARMAITHHFDGLINEQKYNLSPGAKEWIQNDLPRIYSEIMDGKWGPMFQEAARETSQWLEFADQLAAFNQSDTNYAIRPAIEARYMRNHGKPSRELVRSLRRRIQDMKNQAYAKGNQAGARPDSHKELIRDFQELQRIKMLLPKEIRAEIGGFVELAKVFGTPAAKQKRRNILAEKLDAAEKKIEQWLREEYELAIHKAIEKRLPQSRVGTRRLQGRNMHHLASDKLLAIHEMMMLSEAEVEDAKEKLEEEIRNLAAKAEKDEDFDPVALLAELDTRQVELDFFTNLHRKDADSLANVLDEIERIIERGRTTWAVLEEARKAEVNRMVDVAKDSFSGGKGKMGQGGAAEAELKRDRSFFRALGAPNRWMRNFMQLLNRAEEPNKETETYQGPVTDYFDKLVYQATHDTLEADLDFDVALMNELSDHFGIKRGVPYWEVKVAKQLAKLEEKERRDVYKIEGREHSEASMSQKTAFQIVDEIMAADTYKDFGDDGEIEIDVSDTGEMRTWRTVLQDGKTWTRRAEDAGTSPTATTFRLNRWELASILEAVEEHRRLYQSLIKALAEVPKTVKVSYQDGKEVQEVSLNPEQKKRVNALNAKLRGMEQRNIKYRQVTKPGQLEQMLLSEMQMVYLTMVYAQDPKSMDYNGYTPGTMEKMEELLSKEAKAFREFAYEQFERTYDVINKQYRARYGVSLPRVVGARYAPISRLTFKTVVDKDLLMDRNFGAVGTSPGFTQQRVNTTADVKIVSALALLQQHVGSANHYAHWSAPVRLMQGVLGNKDVQILIEQYSGKTLNRQIQERIEEFGLGGVQRQAGLMVLDRMRGYSAIKALGANIGVFFKQWTSGPAYLSDVPLDKALVYMTEFMMNPKGNMQFLWNTEFARTRFHKGFSRDMMALINDTNLSPSYLRAIANDTMITGKLGDIVPILTWGYVAYRYGKELAQQTDPNITPEAAEQAGIQFWGRMTERQQQAGNLKDLGWLESRGSIQRMFTLFKTSLKQYYLHTAEAFIDMVNGRKSGKKIFAKRLFFSWILMGLLFNAVSQLFNLLTGDDDDEFNWLELTYSSLWGPLNGVFLFGEAADTGVRALINRGVNHYNEVNPGAVEAATIANYGYGNFFMDFFESTKRAGIEIFDLIEEADEGELDAADFTEAGLLAADVWGRVSARPSGAAAQLASILDSFLKDIPGSETSVRDDLFRAMQSSRDKASTFVSDFKKFDREWRADWIRDYIRREEVEEEEAASAFSARTVGERDDARVEWIQEELRATKDVDHALIKELMLEKGVKQAVVNRAF